MGEPAGTLPWETYEYAQVTLSGTLDDLSEGLFKSFRVDAPDIDAMESIEVAIKSSFISGRPVRVASAARRGEDVSGATPGTDEFHVSNALGKLGWRRMSSARWGDIVNLEFERRTMRIISE